MTQHRQNMIVLFLGLFLVLGAVLAISGSMALGHNPPPPPNIPVNIPINEFHYLPGHEVIV